MSKNLQLLKDYFDYFSSKDIDSLSSLFSEDIELYDWNTSFIGKKEVIQEVNGIFDNFESIDVVTTEIFSSTESNFACQIEIIFNGDIDNPLYVMDLIEFDINDRIKKVTAYNRNFGK